MKNLSPGRGVGQREEGPASPGAQPGAATPLSCASPSCARPRGGVPVCSIPTAALCQSFLVERVLWKALSPGFTEEGMEGKAAPLERGYGMNGLIWKAGPLYRHRPVLDCHTPAALLMVLATSSQGSGLTPLAATFWSLFHGNRRASWAGSLPWPGQHHCLLRPRAP